MDGTQMSKASGGNAVPKLTMHEKLENDEILQRINRKIDFKKNPRYETQHLTKIADIPAQQVPQFASLGHSQDGRRERRSFPQRPPHHYLLELRSRPCLRVRAQSRQCLQVHEEDRKITAKSKQKLTVVITPLRTTSLDAALNCHIKFIK